jgi:hypothetical protein
MRWVYHYIIYIYILFSFCLYLYFTFKTYLEGGDGWQQQLRRGHGQGFIFHGGPVHRSEAIAVLRESPGWGDGSSLVEVETNKLNNSKQTIHDVIQIYPNMG